MKAMWEYTLKQLDDEIARTKAVLEASGSKELEEYLAVLEEQREERLIEDEILKGSRYAKEVLGLDKPVLQDELE